MGGAVTASDMGAGAAWYNPGGLAHDVSTKLEANVSVYGLELWSAEDAVTTSDGGSAPAKFTNWQLVPSTFAIIKNLAKDLNGAFVVLVPRTTDAVSQIQAVDANGEVVSGEIVIGTAYYFGLGLGWQPREGLRLGATLFGLYSWSYESNAAGLQTTDGHLSLSELLSESTFGLRANVGLQWDISRQITVGASVMSPSLTLLTTNDRTSVATGVMGGTPLYDSQVASESYWGVNSFDPLKVRLGLLGRLHERFEMEGNVSVSLPNNPKPATPYDADREEALDLPDPYERRWLVNGAVGGLYHVSDETTLGAGIFTDLNPWSHHGFNYFGATFGYESITTFELKDGSKFQFSTTLGARYAYGQGKFSSTTVATDPSDPTETVERTAHTHELSLNVGSSIRF
jgi:hypothetical protein